MLRTQRMAALCTVAACLLAASIGTAAPAPGLQRAVPPDNLFGFFACQQSYRSTAPAGGSKWVLANRGLLTLNVDNYGHPTTYSLSAYWLSGGEPPAGTWSWTGTHVAFHGGALAANGDQWPEVIGGWDRRARRAPHDTLPGRTVQLVLMATGPSSSPFAPAVAGQEGTDSASRSYWYCGTRGVIPRTLFTAAALRRVRRVSGIPVRLPTWDDSPAYGGAVTKLPRYGGRVFVLKRGMYRLTMKISGTTYDIFSAKRAPAKELINLPAVRLARGITGAGGGVGCAFDPGLHGWGPVYCGRDVVVWHSKGVNYAVESATATLAQLIGYADTMILDGRKAVVDPETNTAP